MLPGAAADLEHEAAWRQYAREHLEDRLLVALGGGGALTCVHAAMVCACAARRPCAWGAREAARGGQRLAMVPALAALPEQGIARGEGHLRPEWGCQWGDACLGPKLAKRRAVVSLGHFWPLADGRKGNATLENARIALTSGDLRENRQAFADPDRCSLEHAHQRRNSVFRMQ